MAFDKLIIIHGGELSKDVAEQLQAKKPASLPLLQVELRPASKSPKTLLSDSTTSTTLHCFILQTIENAAPTEDGGTTVRFFQRKTHPTDLLKDTVTFHYTVLGLGDSNLLLDRQTTTAVDCNQVAQQLDKRLQELGGTRYYELGLGDERSELVEVEPWISGLWAKLV